MRGVTSDLISVTATPRLRAPVFCLALTGWVDAGFAGITALEAVVSQLNGGSARRIATIELSELLDLQATRPTVSLRDGLTREIAWPRIEFFAGAVDGMDVIAARGPEPSLCWPSVSRAIADYAAELGTTRAFTFGAIPSAVSHRRPVSVLATASDAAIASLLTETRPDYHGPTGLQTVVQADLGDLEIPTIGLWAQVPHYVAGNPALAATRAILEHFARYSHVPLPLHVLDAATEEWVRQVEAGLEDRPDVLELIAQIEAAADAADDTQLPSGDELATEIERFLRGE